MFFKTTRVLLGGLVHKPVKWSPNRKAAARVQRARITNVENELKQPYVVQSGATVTNEQKIPFTEGTIKFEEIDRLLNVKTADPKLQRDIFLDPINQRYK